MSSHNAHAVPREFSLQDTVYARNYGSGSLWVPGKVVSLRGSAMYDVQLSNKQVVRRHIDQLHSCVSCGGSGTSPDDFTLDSLASSKGEETQGDP